MQFWLILDIAYVARYDPMLSPATTWVLGPARIKENDMSENMLWFLIVGLIAGWLAGVLVKGGGFGLIGDLVVGVLGAFVGGWLFSTFGVAMGGGLFGSILVATIGAVVLLLIVRIIRRV